MIQQQLSIFSIHFLLDIITLCFHNLTSEPDGDPNAALSLIYKNRKVQYKDKIFPFHCSLLFPMAYSPRLTYEKSSISVLCYFSHLFCSYFSPSLSPQLLKTADLVKTKLKLPYIPQFLKVFEGHSDAITYYLSFRKLG